MSGKATGGTLLALGALGLYFLGRQGTGPFAPRLPASTLPDLPYLPDVPFDLQDFAAQAARETGLPVEWSRSESLWNIARRESGFNPLAQNTTSTAFGMFQFLNATWETVGEVKSSSPYVQIRAALKYIARRPQYGDPDAAWSWWQDHQWY